jgi:hypothetical protein
MKKSIITLLIAVIIVLSFPYCNRHQLEMLKEDPIITIGHGAFIGQDGKPLEINEKFLEQMQDYYIAYLGSEKAAMGEGADFNAKKADEIRKIIYKEVEDKILANALYLDWLIDHKKPGEGGRYPVINNALRWYYLLKIKKDKVLPNKKGEWYKGLTKDVAGRLGKFGIEILAVTNSGMDVYCQECEDAGVPVPRNMFGSEWQNMGSFDGQEFISGSLDPQLLIKVSVDPPGFCLALPRYNADSKAELFGVICMSTVTSRVCFFDNPNGTFYNKDNEIDFRNSFVGGQDLVANGQGICSDCHAGENPYIVHPDVPAFENFITLVGQTTPPRWHVPMVPGTWPQNPGPTYILDGITTGGQCNSCHTPSDGGRFPRVSALPGYCRFVLTNAVGNGTATRTMPPYGMSMAGYEAQRDALLNSCRKSDKEGDVVTGTPPSPNDSFISPPTVIGPLYACATAVSVRGAVLDAKVTLFIDGMEVASISPARSTTQIEFTGLSPLTKDALVTAVQVSGAAVSAPSAPVKVKDYREDYPGGMPTPTIDPIIYECAGVIAVKHLPGATITVHTDGANPQSRSTSTGYSAINPSGRPFSVGMKFTVVASMCTDTSPTSAPITARTAPSILPIPTLDPAIVYNGQEIVDVSSIVQGAKVSFQISSIPWSGSLETPITWFPDYDLKSRIGRAIRSGDFLQTSQGLCSSVSVWSTPDQKTDNCEQLPAARIDPPNAGATYVSVYESVPGSRIIIYDSGGNEIGDGSGTVVNLRRALMAGETIRIVQRLGECTSRFIYQVRVGG